MVAQYLKPLMPYSAVKKNQIDQRWVERGYGVESIFFSLPSLAEIKSAREILISLPDNLIKTIHYPMMGNYLVDKHARKVLSQLVSMAGDVGAHGMVLHANNFIDIENVSKTNFSKQRIELGKLYNELELEIFNMNIWIGIENMPLVGDLGDDVDAAFIEPEHYSVLTGNKIGLTLDTAHLVGAIETRKNTPEDLKSYLPPGEEMNFKSFATIKSKIKHLHIGAVKGVAIPPRYSTASGGYVPAAEDTVYEEIISSVIRNNLTASLEINEIDYSNRVNIWKMRNWLITKGFLLDD